MKSLWLMIVVTAVGIVGLTAGNPMRAGCGFWQEAHCLSIEKERDLGDRVFREIQKEMEIVQIPSVQVYIDTLGTKLGSNAHTSEFPFRFMVLKESEPNAFAIPGGRIFITSGLICLVESEDELAGVVGHEIAHVVRRHIAERIEASKRLNLPTLAGILAGLLVGGQGGGAVMAGSLALAESKMLKYTRDNESEADRLGLAYMTQAGYDGCAMISFLRKIYRTTQYDTEFPSYLSTHPGVPFRISYLETLLNGPSTSTSTRACSSGLKRIQTQLFILEKGPLGALNHFTDILATHPNDVEALFGRALAKKEMGRVTESIEDLRQAHILNPDDPQILKELGPAFTRVGRVKEGIRALERSLALSGEDAETFYYLGEAYQIQKELTLAVESYLRVETLYPDMPGIHRKLGSVYREKGDMGESHFHYGLYFEREGEPKYARFHFEKALELSGENLERQEEIRRHLESVDR
jgi:predicted Zn-dependent protease